ncbi:hypothetical protein [Mycoplasmopsis cricetuli]|uniref:hypothetical protein n=1 Tax=Mycoplasmopsis cricetuli TaxID=171283 RepID=UPI000470347A|nr:hypothetical protein [Mycoplasmopsis cricetuli]
MKRRFFKNKYPKVHFIFAFIFSFIPSLILSLTEFRKYSALTNVALFFSSLIILYLIYLAITYNLLRMGFKKINK